MTFRRRKTHDLPPGWGGFVDIHTHVVPSGDDGAASIQEGIDLCALAARSGTRMVFATPHMQAENDQYPWSPEREALFESSFEPVQAGARLAGLELRRGRELYPTEVFDVDLNAVRLEGTSGVLIEFPGGWLDVSDPVQQTWDACVHVAAEGFVPILAHPERCPELSAAPSLAEAFAAQGWLLCPNASSFLGTHGETACRTAMTLLDRGVVSLVASDGHRLTRPPTLDEVWRLLNSRIGPARATRLLDGSAVPWLEQRVETGSSALGSHRSR